MTWLLSWSVALAGPLSLADVDRALAACATKPVNRLPTLSAEHKKELLDGNVVRFLERNKDGPSAAVGIAILNAPREALWIAMSDPHTQVDPSVTEFVVEYRDGDTALWYGYFDLPRPVQDRQWVIEARNNHAMANATNQRCWEHLWVLDKDGLAKIRDMVATQQPRGITLEHLDRAIFTPDNRGAWIMAELDESRVLVAYTAATTVAGMIPDWLIAQLAKSRLESVLRSLEERANTWATNHYRQGHGLAPGGDGRPLPYFE